MFTFYSTLPTAVTFTNSKDIFKADTGASKTYLKPQHKKYLHNFKLLKNGPIATLPNNEKIQATGQGLLALSPKLKIPSLIYDRLTSESLLSIGQLCDEGCIAIFLKQRLYIFKHNECILQGKRNLQDGLWDIPFPDSKMNYIVTKDKDKLELAQYLHGCAFSPAITTFQKSINKGNFITWPGIDTINFKKVLGTPIATHCGHLDQERKNMQSTQKTNNRDVEKNEDNNPKQEKCKTKNCFYSITQLDHHNKKAYTDLTGRFPVQSARGHNYIFICYDYDANAILAEPMKNREADSIVNAWTKCHRRLTNNGHEIKKYVLDNECSNQFKDVLKKEEIEYELVPPAQHRRNAAERAIRTFKNHFIAGLETCDPDYPLREWDRLIPQAELTLNLLRNSRINPKLSAWSYLFGNHDFNKSPLAPPGTRVILHSKPDNRKSWAYHGEKGFYVGPATEHYRCLRCFIPKTGRERISDTVAFVPNRIAIPHANIDTHLRRSTSDIVQLLKERKVLFPNGSNTSANALQKLAEMLNNDATPAIAPSILNTNSS